MFNRHTLVMLTYAAIALAAALNVSAVAAPTAPVVAGFEPLVSLYDPARGGLPESQGSL